MTTNGSAYGVSHLELAREPKDTWWARYAATLRASGISSTSLEAIEVDAQYIVDECVFGAGAAGSEGWPDSRERSGVVMGAVQSGKTASMLAVIAKALDRGVDAVVVLAGTRTALWQQTLARLHAQLDTWDQPWSRRVLLPGTEVLRPDAPAQELGTLYALQAPRAKKAIEGKVPIIAVVMKNVFHLERAAMTMHKHVYPAAAQRAGAFHVLVLDDEADDSSILDAVTEARSGVSAADTKQVPRRIADLWEARTAPGETTQKSLYATYLAYTATPQANFLQDRSNPLAPRDFAVSLRTPGPEGALVPRMTSYRDPMGLKAWYTGGEIFYKALKHVPLCRTEDPAEDAFGNALRAFLVACAVRLWREPARLGPSSGRESRFETSEEASATLAKVASMLIHPSSAKDDHFDVAAQVLAWADGTDQKAARARVDAGERSLSVEGIRRRINEEPERWQYWLQDFSRGAEICENELSLPARPEVPSASSWDEIKRLILEEVVPATHLAVINSDDSADDRPDFQPRQLGTGWGPPPNHSTIFVSGNVMARGLTLEGLTTTLFSRQSDAPLADTQMQMQRWFGYRGSVIELCRAFMTKAQLELFSAYHEADEALRREIMSAMNTSGGVDRALTVLQGYDFAATGKIANVAAASIWPGGTPFVQHLNPPEKDTENANRVAGLFDEQGYEVVRTKDGHELGLILREELDLEATARLLDSLRYDDHGPGPDGPEAARWRSVASHLGLEEGRSPIYRAPSVPESLDFGKESPYSVAAYLRVWKEALLRHAPGFTTTDPPHGPWSLVDLGERARTQPRFRVGLRFGRGPSVVKGPLATIGHAVRTMEREITSSGALASTWGARGAANQRQGVGRYPGDEYFDYFARGEKPPARTTWGSTRAPGEPGLVLFHPIDRGAGSCSLAVGMSIPLGGPDQVAAVPLGTSA